MNAQIHSIENLIATDPGRRNVFALMIPDQLQRAAESLLTAKRVGIVSGCYIPAANAGETDGPPGAKALGDALIKLGITVDYITDGWNLVQFEAMYIDPILEVSDYLHSSKPSHLVSIERIGQGVDGRYRNMLGEDITCMIAPLDELFLTAHEQGIITIGIGDGGNEIGMGKVFAETLANIKHGQEIATVVSTDLCIVAGVSNWGAYGLVGALSILTKQDLLPTVDEAAQAIQLIVSFGAVDGVTHRNEETVDGIPLSGSIQILENIRRQIAPSPLQQARKIHAGILGYGQTGRAAARLLLQKGHRVRVSDQSEIEMDMAAGIEAVETSKHTVEFFQDCDVVIASPGIAPDHEIFKALHRRGIPVMSEMEMAYQLSNRPIIAVTGSVGKRSTVELLSQLFTHAGKGLQIGGNKGEPISALLLDQENSDPIAVAVSSFQLENVIHFRPWVSALLNIHEEHLDRHGSVAEYIRIKSRVFMNHGSGSTRGGRDTYKNKDILILPYDNERLRSLATKHRGKTWYFSTRQEVQPGAWIDDNNIIVNTDGSKFTALHLDEHQPILHYPENLLVSILIARCFDMIMQEISDALACISFE